MKTFLIALTAILLFNSASTGQVRLASIVNPKGQAAQTKNFHHMIGSWEIVGEQDTGAGLEVIDSTTILIRFMGEEKKLLEYRIDFSKSPCWFDFSAKDTASVSNFKSLIEFVNDDMLKWQVFVDEERTNHFTSSKGEIFYLKRSRPKSNTVSFNNATNP